MDILRTSFVGLLKKVDPSFEMASDQSYVVNLTGFEVYFIGKEANDADTCRLPLFENDDYFLEVEARRVGLLEVEPKFSVMIVARSGHMARRNTISPTAFIKFKRWISGLKNREFHKCLRDQLQADLVELLVRGRPSTS